MKNIFKTIGLLALTGLIFTSCNDEDENTGQSLIDNFTPVAVQVSTLQSSYTFSEKNIDSADPLTNTINVTATLPEPQVIDAVLEFVVSGNNDHDIELGSDRVVIKAGSTSATTAITIMQTGEIEGTENFVVSLKSLGNFTTDFSLPITINDDYINNSLDVSAAWAGSYTYSVTGAEVTIDFCDMDFDVVLYDEAGTTPLDYPAATSSCPESGAVSGAPDGKYKLALDLYENDLAVFGANRPVPITVTYGQEYISEPVTFTYDGFTTDSPTGVVMVADVEVKDGYMYIVTVL